jgi:hypothetical protein
MAVTTRRGLLRFAAPYLQGAARLIDFPANLRPTPRWRHWSTQAPWVEVEMNGNRFVVVIHDGPNRILVETPPTPDQPEELELPLNLGADLEAAASAR